MHETFSRSVQVRFSLLVDLTWTSLGNVSCMTSQNQAVEITMEVSGESKFHFACVTMGIV